MTETFYSTGNYNTDHRTFGGKIYDSDFYRKTSLSDIAARIEADKKFDKLCKKIVEERKNGGK